MVLAGQEILRGKAGARGDMILGHVGSIVGSRIFHTLGSPPGSPEATASRIPATLNGLRSVTAEDDSDAMCVSVIRQPDAEIAVEGDAIDLH